MGSSSIMMKNPSIDCAKNSSRRLSGESDTVSARRGSREGGLREKLSRTISGREVRIDVTSGSVGHPERSEGTAVTLAADPSLRSERHFHWTTTVPVIVGWMVQW